MWAILPMLSRLYLLGLFFAALYMVFSFARTSIVIRGFRKRPADSVLESTARALADRLTNLHRLHYLLLLLFGACFADHLFATIRSLQHDYMNPAAERIEPFGTACAFAFCVFLVLTLLHAFHWAVSALLSPYTRTRKGF